MCWLVEARAASLDFSMKSILGLGLMGQMTQEPGTYSKANRLGIGRCASDIPLGHGGKEPMDILST